MAKPESISRLTYWGALGLLTLAFLFFVGFNIYKEYKKYVLNITHLKQAVINERKEILATNLREMISLIYFQESMLESNLKNHLKDGVTIVEGIFSNVHTELKGILPEEKIKNLLISAIKNIKFPKGRGHFFIIDATTLNPLNGTFGEDYEDVYGNFVLKEFVDVATKSGGGFIENYWYLSEDNKTPFKEISYVKFFKPFNWIIGSGDYVEHLREQIKEKFAKTVSQSSTTNSRVNVIMFSYTDNDKCISSEDVCRKFSYLKSHLREGFLRLKDTLFYIHKCPTWKIYIVSAYSLKDIEKELSQPLTHLKEAMIKDIFYSTAAGLGFYMFMFIVTNRFLKKIREQENEVKKQEYKILKESRKLFRQLYTDPVTGLPNRNKFNLDVENNRVASIGLFNIDRFREINDVFGYDFGDYVLKTVGKFIKKEAKTANPKLKVYRISGDEFVIADLYNKLPKSSFKLLIEKIVDKLNTMIIKDHNNAVSINVSAGVAVKEDNPLRKADIALADAKKNSDKRVIIYNPTFTKIDRYRENIIWIEKIKNALLEDRIVPYYQPIIHNQTGKIIKYEVLARLIDKDGKVYTPFYFLGIAKQYKIYPEISRRIIKKSVETIKKEGVHLSINLSLSDILNIEVRNFILRTIRKSNVGNKITFEILEDESIEGSYDVMEFISTVKMYGVQIAIDDFGRGYSNFSYLTKLQVDGIKIDGLLIKNINHDKTHRAIVEAIVTFAKKSGILTTAEFVENKDILDTVKELGIDCSQGFYIGKPSPKILDKS